VEDWKVEVRSEEVEKWGSGGVGMWRTEEVED
jgi:hypothetical protein